MPPHDTHQSQFQLGQRSSMYRLLSAAFCEPTVLWREEALFANLQELLTSLFPHLDAAARQLHAAFDASPLDDLCVEAARLFIGPFELPVPPYGSCYLDGEHRTMGDSTIAVQSFYRDWQVTLSHQVKEVPDHIAIELEFVHMLLHSELAALRTADASQAGRAAAARQVFLTEFLLPFGSAFAERLQAETESAFYQALARVLGGVLAADAAGSGGSAAQ